MIRNRSADQNPIAGLNLVRMKPATSWHATDPGSGDVHAVGVVSADDFGVAGEDSDTRFGRGFVNRIENLFEEPFLEALGENHAQRDSDGLGPANGQVIDCPADRQSPDVAAGKLKRLDDVTVYRHRDSRAR